MRRYGYIEKKTEDAAARRECCAWTLFVTRGLKVSQADTEQLHHGFLTLEGLQELINLVIFLAKGV